MSNMASRLLVISKAVSLIEPPIRSDIELINSAYATRLDYTYRFSHQCNVASNMRARPEMENRANLLVALGILSGI